MCRCGSRNHPYSPLTCVAYFSMEFGLSEALPIYSGGLGNVAGDQLKAANDLGVPVVGVGLLYQQGYFRQFIDADGNQTALYPYNDPGQLPITAVRDADGEWFRLAVNLPGGKLWLRAWQAQVGRVTLYLLDSNDPANSPVYRGMTSELYGGGPEMRLQQELILGIGGWRLLHGLGIKPEVCHLNEGHAAFAVLERARDFMDDSGQPFAVALEVTRAGNLFTTHTPVPAGFDRFTPAMMERYFKFYAENAAQYRDDGSDGAGAQESGRFRRTLQHGLSGNSWQRRGQRRQPPAWRGQPRHLPGPVRALAACRGADRVRHQRRPYADLGLGRGRPDLDRGLRARPLARHDGVVAIKSPPARLGVVEDALHQSRGVG